MKNYAADEEYWSIPRECAALVDEHLGTGGATSALQIVAEYLEMDTTKKIADPAVLWGMQLFRNAISQHLRAMEYHLRKEREEPDAGATRAPSGDV